MKRISKIALIAIPAIAISTLSMSARRPKGIAVTGETIVINAHTMDSVTVDPDVWDQLYGPTDWHYEVRQSPRLLVVVDDGNLAIGMGALLKGTIQYDFDGSCPANGAFIPQEIAMTSTNRDAGFNGTVNNSKMYARVVGKSRLGVYGAYIETDFSDGFYVRQAWANLGYLRMGKATSIFHDDDCQPFTIDEQGPNGASCSENMAVQWTPRFGRDGRWTAAVGIEVPDPAMADEAAWRRQRVPDVPAYLQYSWSDRASRLRLAGIYRRLQYVDIESGSNRGVNGWGAEFSGVISDLPRTTLMFQAMYGRGIAQYVNDLSGYGYDLVMTNRPGVMKAPQSLSFFGTLQYNFTDSFFMSATYSQARLYGCPVADAESYRMGRYVAVNAVCCPIAGMQVGIEWDWGRRTDHANNHAHADRLMLMCAYAF